MKSNYKVGDLVSVERWDNCEPPNKRLGTPSKVIAVKTGQVSETGVMVTVQSLQKNRRQRTLDQNWLRTHLEGFGMK